MKLFVSFILNGAEGLRHAPTCWHSLFTVLDPTGWGFEQKAVLLRVRRSDKVGLSARLLERLLNRLLWLRCHWILAYKVEPSVLHSVYLNIRTFCLFWCANSFGDNNFRFLLTYKTVFDVISLNSHFVFGINARSYWLFFVF